MDVKDPCILCDNEARKGGFLLCEECFAKYSFPKSEPAIKQKNKEQQIKSLSSHQIMSLIKKGKWVEELKAEWFKRWGMEFPYYKDISGIKEMK